MWVYFLSFARYSKLLMSLIGLKHKDTLRPTGRLNIVQVLTAKCGAGKERCDQSRERSKLQLVSLHRWERKMRKVTNGTVTIVTMRKKKKTKKQQGIVFLTKNRQCMVQYLCPTSLLPHKGCLLSSLKHVCEQLNPLHQHERAEGKQKSVFSTFIKSLLGSVHRVTFEST